MIPSSMRILKASECERIFDFFIYQPSPKNLVPIAWGNYLLTGCEPNGSVVSLPAESNFTAIVREIYPELSFVELSRLRQNLRQLNFSIWGEILESYQLLASESVELTADALDATPESFRIWAHEKKLMPRDLAPLRLPIPKEFDDVLRGIAESRATRQEGCQILELSAELFLGGTSILDIRQHSSSEKWLAHLKKLRFPRTSRADEEMRQKIKSLNWPPHVDAEWLRRGDQTGLQIKFFAATEAELTRRLEGIKGIKHVWTN